MLLFEDDALDKLLLADKFGILSAHLADKGVDKPVDEGLFETEESVAVADSTAQDSADDISGFGIAGQLPVGDAEADGTQVVGDDAHGNIGLLVLAVGAAGHVGNLLDKGLEDIGVVVGFLALHDHAEALESHACVDMFGL